MSGANTGGAREYPGISSLGREVLAVVWTLTGVSGLILAIRIYCKTARKRGLWWDDYVLTLSWIFLVIPSATTTREVQLGFGNHVYQINPANFPELGPLGQTTAFFSILGALLSKVSFAITLLRISQGWVRAIVWFVISSMSVFMTLSAIFTWTQCTPVAKIWDKSVPGTCWDPQIVPNYNVFSGVYSGVMDICLAMLPWPIVLNLQMTKKDKFGVAVAMSMGVFAGITGFIKSAKIPSLASGDFFVDGIALMEWGAAETATTIIATSIPVLRALFSEIRKNSSRGYFKQSWKDPNNSSSLNQKSAVNTVVSTSRGYDRSQVRRADTGSDRSILASNDNIVKTSEVTVQYDRTRAEEEGFEMAHFSA